MLANICTLNFTPRVLASSSCALPPKCPQHKWSLEVITLLQLHVNLPFRDCLGISDPLYPVILCHGHTLVANLLCSFGSSLGALSKLVSAIFIIKQVHLFFITLCWFLFLKFYQLVWVQLLQFINKISSPSFFFHIWLRGVKEIMKETRNSLNGTLCNTVGSLPCSHYHTQRLLDSITLTACLDWMVFLYAHNWFLDEPDTRLQ